MHRVVCTCCCFFARWEIHPCRCLDGGGRSYIRSEKQGRWEKIWCDAWWWWWWRSNMTTCKCMSENHRQQRSTKCFSKATSKWQLIKKKTHTKDGIGVKAGSAESASCASSSSCITHTGVGRRRRGLITLSSSDQFQSRAFPQDTAFHPHNISKSKGFWSSFLHLFAKMSRARARRGCDRKHWALVPHAPTMYCNTPVSSKHTTVHTSI